MNAFKINKPKKTQPYFPGYNITSWGGDAHEDSAAAPPHRVIPPEPSTTSDGVSG